MKPFRLFLTFGLFAGLMASACAPALTSSPAAAGEPFLSPSIAATTAETASPSAIQPKGTATLAPLQTVLPLATSRGPELHATDPATVNLAAGQLQLVEFFRFT